MDEIVPFEIRKLHNLINAIFIDAVTRKIKKLRREKCCGCKVNHPSQRRHECLMMTEEEGWIEHGIEAIERMINQETVWKIPRGRSRTKAHSLRTSHGTLQQLKKLS